MYRLTQLCARHAGKTVAAAIVLSALAGWSILNTQRAVGTDANLGADHNAVRQFADFLELYGGGYPVVIAYDCREPAVCTSALDPAALEMADAVSRRLERTAFVSRVASPATTRLLVASGDLGIEARQLYRDGAAVDDPRLRAIALGDPLWSRTLISPDGSVGAVVVELSSTESRALSTVIHEIRRAIEPFARDFHFHLVGEAVLFVESQEAGLSSATRAGVATGGMLFLTLLLLVRSLPVVIATLATIGVASVGMLGLLPLLGWRQSELTNGAATLILVIGCADCVHFAARYLETRANYEDDPEALRDTARWVLAPCFLTTATTAGAFASFASGNVVALTQFGVLSAIGIVLVFLLTFTLFPALLRLLPTRARAARDSAAWQEVLTRITNLGTRRSRLVLAFALALALVGISGIPKLEVEMNIAELWARDHPVMRAIEFVSRNLQRAERLEIDVRIPADAHLESPEIFGTLARLEARLGAMPEVGQVRSLLSVLRQANGLLRKEGSALPDSESGMAELLFLTSAGAAGTLDPWMTLDQRHVRISAEVEDLSMQRKIQLISNTDELLGQILPSGWSATLTGPVVLTSRYGAEFSRGQANIISVSSVIVCAMIGVYLRSIPWAILAVIPNAIALLLLFGAMGHWGMRMNFGSAIVAPIAIGIATDDTIHFLTAYARERRGGLAPVPAVSRAIAGVGEAVVATAIALSLGFLSMIASPMASVADMGLLCAIAIVGATLADLFLLPALISTVARWKRFERLPRPHA